MRILTVRQPWAWAIIHGGKDVENRVRNIAGDYRGPVAIHAAQREDTSARRHPEIIRLAAEQWWTDPASLLVGRRDQFGHVIGVVDLSEVHHSGPSDFGGEGTRFADLCSPWAQQDAWHLVLSNARALAEPIPYRGALGLRRLEDETTARILAQIGG
jgi:hypothetical protein